MPVAVVLSAAAGGDLDELLQVAIRWSQPGQEAGLWVGGGNGGLLSGIKEVSPENSNWKEVHMETPPIAHTDLQKNLMQLREVYGIFEA